MNRHTLWLSGMAFGLSSILVLGSGYVQAQTPNQVAKFDPNGTGNPVDSAINETNGFVGVGGPNGSNSVLQLFGQDGLRISGYEPFLTLEDTNAFNRRGVIASANGDLVFVPDSFFGGSGAVVIKNNSGNVGIGVDVPSYRLQLPNIADFRGRGLANAWLISSSRRWKENITPIDNALAKVERLRGVYYDWKEGKQHDIGLIAEEVGEVIPEVVTYEKNGKDAVSVDYARLTALLVEAAKELKAENKALQGRIDALEGASSTVRAPAPMSSAFALIGLATLGLVGYSWRCRKPMAA